VVRLWVANTDSDWFDFLASQSGIDEVNFWQPSGSSNFGAIQPGELFVFRLKSPRNAIGGYGIFHHATNLPISLAWEAFDIKNGASSFEELHLRIGRLRDPPPAPHEDFVIGVRIVLQPVFFPERFWIPQPDSWSRSIMVGKTYNTETQEGLRLWERLIEAGELLGKPLGGRERPQARYGEPTLVTPRLGQGAFRVSVTDAYRRVCAVTGGKVLPALDAAHIKPYASGGPHEVSNGLLLRRDIHSIFDAGYATISEDLRFIVSDRVRSEFNNGEEYRRLHGQPLIIPSMLKHPPDREALRWHRDIKFRV
jgi:putative restriction endonuclease